MADTNTIPLRREVSTSDRWDLTKLFPDDESWENGLKEFESMIGTIESFRGMLGESASRLRECFDFMNRVELLDERLGYYAHLRVSEDLGESKSQDRMARYMSIATKVSASASYQVPEIQVVPDETMQGFLNSPELQPFEIKLRKILRFKPHILSENEERLLALQAEANQTANQAFSALTDVDMEFGEIDTDEGKKPLSQSTFSSFLIDQDRTIRETAYRQFYAVFESHKNAIAALYNGSVLLDVYRARIRNYPSARAAGLFPDDVPESVYDNLIESVHEGLPVLHRYYALRSRILEVAPLRHFDVYVPLVREIKVKHTYDQAVALIGKALRPLGSEYVETLGVGLSGGWVDRYENRGKRSGAFSAGSFAGDPYILMNYKEDVLRDVFTLAHEGGHSMHSFYSAKHNPFQHYNYTIFEAEVASTFNEQLLADYLMRETDSDAMKAYLIGKQVDDIIGTFFRQTMFAEFEACTHQMVESGRSLTVDSLRSTYRKLLEQYFGPALELDEVSDLEGLRIPHFYSAFYVYKYATGIAAAIALSRTVMEGGETECDRYLSFLKSGGSKFPLESLKTAGVDMSTPEPTRATAQVFDELVTELEGLLG